MDLRSTTRRQVLLTNIVSVIFGFAMFAISLVVPQLVQVPEAAGYGMGGTILVAGLVMAPNGLFMMAMAPVSGRISNTKGPKVTLMLGAAVVAVGYGLGIVLMSTIWQLVIFSCVIGAGVGLAYGAMPLLIMGGRTGIGDRRGQQLQHTGAVAGHLHRQRRRRCPARQDDHHRRHGHRALADRLPRHHGDRCRHRPRRAHHRRVSAGPPPNGQCRTTARRSRPRAAASAAATTDTVATAQPVAVSRVQDTVAGTTVVTVTSRPCLRPWSHTMRKASMSTLQPPWISDELDFDPDALRERYRVERERRVRPDGSKQYRRTEGRFGYYAEDPYVEAEFTREPFYDRVDAVVIGGGFGGLLAGARLRQAGLERIRIIEKAGDFGGTWYWNRYPGIHCDIESYVYLPLLEEVGCFPRWKYSPGEEVRQHAMAIGRKFDLYRHACFQTGVSELRWDDSEWIVRTDRDDEMRAIYVVVSNGTLDHPKLPGIPGIEDFAGHTFHTSRWDYGYTGGDANGDLTGLADKRVAVIGTGATAIQAAPHVARDAEHLYLFQRTPSSVDVRHNRPTDPEWAASLEPGWHTRRRENFQAVVTGHEVDEDLVHDAWTASGHVLGKITPTNAHAHLPAEEWERIEEILDFRKMNQLRARVDEIVDDPAAAELLKPWYRYGCKRPTFSDEYLQTFNRANVTLVDTADHGGVERITEHTLVVGDSEYEVDCIVFATGFEVGRSDVLTGRLPVYGRDGVELLRSWSTTGRRTLHGFYSNGFPNLFHLGPIQNAPSVNFVHVLDEQAIHVGAVVDEARRRGVKCVEPSVEAENAWVETIRASSPEREWFDAECTPGYYNNEGAAHGPRQTYGPGPAAFQRLLREWRAGEGINEVLGDAR